MKLVLRFAYSFCSQPFSGFKFCNVLGGKYVEDQMSQKMVLYVPMFDALLLFMLCRYLHMVLDGNLLYGFNKDDIIW